MARIRYNHNTFSTGVISGKVLGNTDFEQYNNSLLGCENFQIQHTGGLTKRGGTYFVSFSKNSGPEAIGPETRVRLIPFIYSSEQSYILEMGDHYIRVYTKEGRVGEDIDTEFSFEDVSTLKYIQNGNHLFLQTSRGIYLLKRIDATSFELESEPIVFSFIPMGFTNSKPIAIRPNAVSGNITFSFVSPDGTAPNPQFAPGFYNSDRDHYLALTYYISQEQITIYLKILNVSDPSPVFSTAVAKIDEGLSPKVNNNYQLPNTDPIVSWNITTFSNDRGWPVAGTTYEGRLFLANNISYPLGIWGSSLLYDDWFNFYPGSNPADAVQFFMNSEEADEILWMVGHSKLFIGTASGVHIAGATTFNDDALTPSNFRVRQFTYIGASPLQPLRVLDGVFFVDKAGINVHEIAMNEAGVYDARDLSLLGNDLTHSGIISHSWQQSPIKTYWCVVNDGYLCSLTYLKNNNIVAWSKHVIAGKNVKVLSVSTIHDGQYDYVWCAVQREINGEIKTYIEYIHPQYDPLDREEFKQFYVDCGITKQLHSNIKNISKSQNATIRADFTPLKERTHTYQQEYLLTFHNNGNEDAFLTNDRILIAKNISDNQSEIFFDTRKLNRAIPCMKVDPLNFHGYRFDDLDSDTEVYVSVSNIIKIEAGPETHIYCDTSNLRDSDSIILTFTGLLLPDDTPVDHKVWGLIRQGDYIVLKTAPEGDEDLPTTLPPDWKLDGYAAVYKKISKVYDCILGTNTQITLTEFPENFVPSVDDDVYLNKIPGMTELNDIKYRIRAIDADEKTLVLYDYQKSPSIRDDILAVLDTQYYSVFDENGSQGNAYFYFDNVEGLEHLAGMQVEVCADGDKFSPKTVPETGVIPLDNPAMYCSVGLQMKAWFQTVPFSGGSLLGSSVGATGSQKDITIHLYNSLGGRYGSESSNTFKIPIQETQSAKFERSQKLFTGMLKLPIPNPDSLYNRTIYIESTEPLAFNVLAITQDIQVSDS